MQKNERIQRFICLTVTFILFILGCILGKVCHENYVDTWFSFNVPALGIFLIGELLWYIVSRKLFEMIEKRNMHKETMR